VNAILTPQGLAAVDRQPETSELQADAARQSIVDLIAPVTWHEFTSQYLGKMPLHVSGDAAALGRLAGPAAVRKLIENGTPWQFRRMPEMYLDGLRIPHEDLVNTYVDMDGREARQPRLGRIRRLLQRGATVNSFGQEGNFEGLAWLREIFAHAFDAECEVATFYSQQDHQGLAPHYDCVEIFVLQLHGRKRWFVSSQRVESPVVGYGAGTMFEASAPHAEIVMEPGDLLYFPRGTFHQAIAMSEESLHATVAVKLPSYLDMLSVLVATAPELAAVRADLPVGGALAWAKAKPQLVSQIAAALERPEFDAALQCLLATRAGT
jgi:mannose-6-phosphate isomerase-like protein (cupin superfamily)